MSRENNKRDRNTPERTASTDLVRRLQEGKTALKAGDLAQLFGVTQQHIYKLAAKGVSYRRFALAMLYGLTRRR
jgi:hypothetical protein